MEEHAEIDNYEFLVAFYLAEVIADDTISETLRTAKSEALLKLKAIWEITDRQAMIRSCSAALPGKKAGF